MFDFSTYSMLVISSSSRNDLKLENPYSMTKFFHHMLTFTDLRDPSTTPLNFTKSINLALSERGINSLRHARNDDLLRDVLKETIPMYGRMIHSVRKDGKLTEESQSYDARGRVCSSRIMIRSIMLSHSKFIRAADRAGLNKSLLDSLEKHPNVRLHFNHKLTGADFNMNTAWFEQQKPVHKADQFRDSTQTDNSRSQDRAVEISVNFDLLIGADGAHSATRYHMMKYARVTYQQEYIDTLWCEFHIKPNSDSSFAISPHHLHIWPGGTAMFIAIPSFDKSFTCTLFASSTYFAFLRAETVERLQPFFAQFFPGVCPELISPEDLQEQFCENPHLPLISIKCTPYHYKASVVILGDAAHAMVPFYGQGMNSGLEDVRVLFEILDNRGVYSHTLTINADQAEHRRNSRQEALKEYTVLRTPDAAAINDLALRNYEEMRAGVQSPLYRIRKWIEEAVHLYLPGLGWSTQYTRVSFENQRYSEVEKAVQKQGRILLIAFGFSVTGFVGVVGLGILRARSTNGLSRVFSTSLR